jgi:hypothetical protein
MPLRPAEELRHLALDLRVAPARGEQLEQEHPEARLVLDRVLQVGDEDPEQLVHRLRAAERLVEACDPVLGVAPDDLDQQGLLGAEVVVE